MITSPSQTPSLCYWLAPKDLENEEDDKDEEDEEEESNDD